MELMSGRSLQDEISQGRRYDWREAANLAINICGALKHAHDHGVIHRDIKPANLLLNSERDLRSVKLSDFGIAKLFGNTNLTVDGGVLGTADYMSPEQAEGQPVSPKTDIYSLGCVIYTMLAGQPPFRGKSLPEVIHKVRFDAPQPIRRLASEVPREMELLLGQLLAKAPEDRVPTALALSKRLQALQHGLTVTPQHDTGTVTERPAGQPLHVQDTLAADATLDGSTTNDPSSAGPKEDHFTEVGSVASSQHAGGDSWLLLAAKLLALSLPAGFLLWTGWLIFGVRSADTLYERAQRAAQSDRSSELLEVEASIKNFLRRYQDDPRRAEVEGWQQRIATLKAQDRLEWDVRSGWDAADVTPLEDLTLNAMTLEKIDGDGAAKAYKDIMSMFPDWDIVAEEDLAVLRVVEIRSAALDLELRRSAERHLALIQNRLDYAEKLIPEDSTAAAKQLTALLTIYAKREWATEKLDRARDMLDRINRIDSPTD